MTETGAALPQVDGQRQDWHRRVRYIGGTLALELVLGGILTLASIIGLFFAPVEIVVTTRYRVDGDSLIASRVVEHVTENWSGSEATTIRVVPVAVAGSSCGPQALEIRTVARARNLEARDLLADAERAAKDAGLGAPCEGARIRINPIPGLRSLTAIGADLIAPLLLFLVWRSRRGRPWLIDWADWTPRVDLGGAFRWGVGIGALDTAIMLGMAWLAQLAGLGQGSEAILIQGMKRADQPWLVPLFVVCAPLVEEYVFRAWMLERFRRVMPAWLALALSALAFMIMHVPHGVVSALVITSAGLLFGLTWLRTRSWLACTLAHAFHNSAVLIALWMALPA